MAEKRVDIKKKKKIGVYSEWSVKIFRWVDSTYFPLFNNLSLSTQRREINIRSNVNNPGWPAPPPPPPTLLLSSFLPKGVDYYAKEKGEATCSCRCRGPRWKREFWWTRWRWRWRWWRDDTTTTWHHPTTLELENVFVVRIVIIILGMFRKYHVS